MALNLEGTIRLTYRVKNDLQVLINPATAVLTITQPDGTTTTPTVTLPPAVTGVLEVDFTPTQSGSHSVHWKTTVPNTAEDDVFTAEAPGVMLVSVDEAIERLNSVGITTTDLDREKLQWRCMVATACVETALGRSFIRRTITATYDGGTDVIRLWKTPVLSVTTVIENGVTLSATPGVDWVLAGPIGFLYRGSTTSLSSWAPGTQNVTVVYQAGYADPPREVRELALGTVQELWQASQQASHPLLEESVALPVESAMSLLSGPLRDAYNRLRRKGVA